MVKPSNLPGFQILKFLILLARKIKINNNNRGATINATGLTTFSKLACMHPVLTLTYSTFVPLAWVATCAPVFAPHKYMCHVGHVHNSDVMATTYMLSIRVSLRFTPDHQRYQFIRVGKAYISRDEDRFLDTNIREWIRLLWLDYREFGYIRVN